MGFESTFKAYDNFTQQERELTAIIFENYAVRSLHGAISIVLAGGEMGIAVKNWYESHDLLVPENHAKDFYEWLSNMTSLGWKYNRQLLKLDRGDGEVILPFRAIGVNQDHEWKTINE
ncbi:hypothetical protein N9137_02170 [Pseudomonadales bacterium]|nr:hypothetical protein [Pseudomonadales bacterium]